MPNPITPEMRAALAEVVDDAECGVLAWHDIGERVCKSLPQLRALLDALPGTVQESRTVEATTEDSSADHSEDARAMVTVEARRAMFEAWARGEGLETTRAPEGSSLSGEYLKPHTDLAWRTASAQWDAAAPVTVADVIAAAESLARKAESLSETPEIYPALYALDMAIDAYRAGHSLGADNAASATPMLKLATIPLGSIGAMTEEIDERTRRIREPIDRAITEVKNGIDEAREALLLQAFKDGMHPGTVEFKWEVMQGGAIRCWLDMHYARPATPEERAEIETQLRATLKHAEP